MASIARIVHNPRHPPSRAGHRRARTAHGQRAYGQGAASRKRAYGQGSCQQAEGLRAGSRQQAKGLLRAGNRRGAGAARADFVGECGRERGKPPVGRLVGSSGRVGVVVAFGGLAADRRGEGQRRGMGSGGIVGSAGTDIASFRGYSRLSGSAMAVITARSSSGEWPCPGSRSSGWRPAAGRRTPRPRPPRFRPWSPRAHRPGRDPCRSPPSPDKRAGRAPAAVPSAALELRRVERQPRGEARRRPAHRRGHIEHAAAEVDSEREGRLRAQLVGKNRGRIGAVVASGRGGAGVKWGADPESPAAGSAPASASSAPVASATQILLVRLSLTAIRTSTWPDRESCC